METLRQWILAGRGRGHGVDYKPWLQMSRRQLHSNSNVNFRYLSTIGRHGHFLSRNEWHIALWLMWLGVEDLREQFPLWPFPHPHPLYDHHELYQAALPASRGTIEIARDLGIGHGFFVGTQIPYIATTDLMISMRDDQGTLRAVAFAVKPSDIANGSRVVNRVTERLLLEMTYASEIGIRWFLSTNRDIPEHVRANLEICYPTAQITHPFCETDRIAIFYLEITRRLKCGEPVGQAIKKASSSLNPLGTAPHILFYQGLWHRKIPIDLRHPILFSQPAVLADFNWVKEKKKQILGIDHE